MSLDTLINLTLAVLLGGAIGFERQLKQGMAGLRTNTLVAFGSACFVTIGMHAGDDRVAAQIVSGMGFLGAGVILHEGPTVRGLNTAATLWCAAAAGSLAAFGMRSEAVYAAAGVVLLNLCLQRVQVLINRHAPHPTEVEALYSIEIVCQAGAATEIHQTLSRGIAEAGGEVRGESRDTLPLDRDQRAAIRLFTEIAAHNRLDSDIREIVEKIGDRPTVTSARWSIGLSGTKPAAASAMTAPSRG